MTPAIETLAPTTVEVWDRDSILYSDHPARVIGPWRTEPEKTLLMLGESGIGLIVAAATVAGKFVIREVSPAVPDGITAADLTALYRNVNEETPEPPSPRRFAPIGILYLGPPCEFAQEAIARVFGAAARTISHGDLDAEQKSAIEAGGIPCPHACMYIGVVPEDQQYSDELAAAEVALQGILPELFVGPFGIYTADELTEAQVEQAVSRIGSGELVILTVPPLPEPKAA